MYSYLQQKYGQSSDSIKTDWKNQVIKFNKIWTNSTRSKCFNFYWHHNDDPILENSILKNLGSLRTDGNNKLKGIMQ